MPSLDRGPVKLWLGGGTFQYKIAGCEFQESENTSILKSILCEKYIPMMRILCIVPNFMKSAIFRCRSIISTLCSILLDQIDCTRIRTVV